MAIDITDVMAQEKRAKNLVATTNVPKAEAQFQREVLAAGQTQTASISESTAIAAEAVQVQGKLTDTQNRVNVELAQKQLEIERKYNADIAPNIQAQQQAAEVALKRSTELTEIAATKSINPLTYLVNSVKAGFIETDLEDAQRSYQSANAGIVLAQDARNRALHDMQAETIVLPMTLAKQSADTALTELKVRGIVTENTYKAAQLNEDTAGQIVGSASRVWQFDETNRARAERKATENAQNHDGIYGIAGLYIARKTGKFPTREEVSRDPVALANAREIYRTQVAEGDRGAFVIAGTKIFAEKLDQLGLSPAAMLAKFGDDAPASFLETAAAVSGDTTMPGGIQAARVAYVNKAAADWDAKHASNPAMSATEKKAQRNAAITAADKYARNLPTPELFAVAKASMAPYQATKTGRDLTSSHVRMIASPEVADRLNLPENVRALLTTPVAAKILDDAPMNTTLGTMEKLSKLEEYMVANGVKNPYSYLSTVFTESTRMGYARDDGTARAMYHAGKSEYIPISLKVSGEMSVQAPGIFRVGATRLAGDDEPAYIKGYAQEKEVDLSEASEMRRAILMYKRGQQEALKRERGRIGTSNETNYVMP